MTYYNLKQLIRKCINEVILDEGRIVCAWCKKDMGKFDNIEGRDSHTICPDCKLKFFPKKVK